MCVGCEIYISELVRSSKLYNGVKYANKHL